MAAAFLLGAGLRGPVCALVSASLLLLSVPGLATDAFRDTAPPFSELEALWTRFWTYVRRGDREAARRDVHSRLRPAFQHGFPATTTGDNLRDIAEQMAHCRLDPRREPSEAGSAAYRVVCRRDHETAEHLVIFREDVDGRWRLFVF